MRGKSRLACKPLLAQTTGNAATALAYPAPSSSKFDLELIDVIRLQLGFVEAARQQFKTARGMCL